jgi:hypothetical protein
LEIVMNSKIELHDSEVSRIHEIGRSVDIEFSPAYVHKSRGKRGIDAGTGWVQNARLRFTGATVSGDRPSLPVTLWDGSLLVGGLEHDNVVPIPLAARGPVELRLVFASGQEIVVSAESIELELIGEASYVEEFSGGDADGAPVP